MTAKTVFVLRISKHTFGIFPARFLRCSMYCLFCVVLVLFVCKCVLYNCHRVETHMQSTNISYHIGKIELQ